MASAVVRLRPEISCLPFFRLFVEPAQPVGHQALLPAVTRHYVIDIERDAGAGRSWCIGFRDDEVGNAEMVLKSASLKKDCFAGRTGAALGGW